MYKYIWTVVNSGLILAMLYYSPHEHSYIDKDNDG